MSKNIFWVYNGWAIFITILGPIYSIIQAESKTYEFYLRRWFPAFFVFSMALLFALSNWIPVVLYIPCWIFGILVASIVKHRGFG